MGAFFNLALKTTDMDNFALGTKNYENLFFGLGTKPKFSHTKIISARKTADF